MLTLDDGSMIVGFIIDMSRSGVAISADIAPKPGARMTIGCLQGQVVRQLDVGFAVQFAELQPAEGLEAAMRTPPAAIPAVPQSA